MVYKFFDKKSQGSGRPLSSASQLKWKGYDNSFNSWIDKKDIV